TQPDVGGVFAALGAARNLNQLDGGLVQLRGEAGETAPVGIRLLADDLAFLHQAFENAHNVEAIAPPLKTQGEVLEVDEDGQRTIPVGHDQSSRNRLSRNISV